MRLASKAVVFGVFLLLLQQGKFGFWPLVFFLAVSLFLYAIPLFRTLELLGIFVLHLAITLISVRTFIGGPYFLLVVSYFSLAFYLILGIKDLVFTQRTAWSRVLHLGLAYPALLLFYYYGQAAILPRLAGIFFVLLILERRLLTKRVASWALSLLTLESVWAIGLLPIGFLSASALALTARYLLTDLGFHYYSTGNLNKKILLTNATVFVILSVLILAVSRWSL